MAVLLRTRRPPGQQTRQTKPQAEPGGEVPPESAGRAGVQDWHKWIILVGLITSAILEVMDGTPCRARHFFCPAS